MRSSRKTLITRESLIERTKVQINQLPATESELFEMDEDIEYREKIVRETEQWRTERKEKEAREARQRLLELEEMEARRLAEQINEARRQARVVMDVRQRVQANALANANISSRDEELIRQARMQTLRDDAAKQARGFVLLDELDAKNDSDGEYSYYSDDESISAHDSDNEVFYMEPHSGVAAQSAANEVDKIAEAVETLVLENKPVITENDKIPLTEPVIVEQQKAGVMDADVEIVKALEKSTSDQEQRAVKESKLLFLMSTKREWQKYANQSLSQRLSEKSDSDYEEDAETPQTSQPINEESDDNSESLTGLSVEERNGVIFDFEPDCSEEVVNGVNDKHLESSAKNIDIMSDSNRLTPSLALSQGSSTWSRTPSPFPKTSTSEPEEEREDIERPKSNPIDVHVNLDSFFSEKNRKNRRVKNTASRHTKLTNQ